MTIILLFMKIRNVTRVHSFNSYAEYFDLFAMIFAFLSIGMIFMVRYYKSNEVNQILKK